MSIEVTASRLLKHVLKRTPRTAGEIAHYAGFPSGRGIARPLGHLKQTGAIVAHEGRYPKYTKV